MQTPNPGTSDIEILLNRWVIAKRNATGREPSAAEKDQARSFLRAQPPERITSLIAQGTPPVIGDRRSQQQAAIGSAVSGAAGAVGASLSALPPPYGRGVGPQPQATPEPAPATAPADQTEVSGPPAPTANVPAATSQGPTLSTEQFSPYDAVFLKYTPTDLQGDLTFRAILAAGTFAESGWDPKRVGDGGESLGLFQMHARGAGAGMGDARADPDAASRVMVPRYAQAYRQIKAQFPGISGSHLAALVAGMAERPQGVDSAGILQAGTAAYNNYVNGWNHVAGGGGARPVGGTAAGPRTPVITGDMLASPQSVLGAITDTWAEAEAQIAALGEFPDPTRVTAIIQGAKAQSDLLTWYQDRADKTDYQSTQNEIARAHLGVAQAGLAQQRDFHADDVRLAMMKMAQEDEQFKARHGLEQDRFALEQYRAGLEEENLAANQTGFFRGERTIAGQSLDQQIAAESNRIRGEFARMQAEGATALGGAESAAQRLRLEAAPWAFGPGQQYVLGREPGGVGERLGLPTRGLETATPIFPNAGIETVRGGIQEALAGHPGNPLLQFTGAG